MASLNKVTLIGNVGKDPEIRVSQNGNQIASFSVATSESWKDKSSGERKEKTEWHRVVCFSPGLCKFIDGYVRKGSQVYVEGQLQTRKWTDKSGQEKYTTEVVIQGYGGELKLIGGKSSGGSGGSEAPSAKEPSFDDLDDEIPF
jgi:single-strand DNA-binding protein